MSTDKTRHFLDRYTIGYFFVNICNQECNLPQEASTEEGEGEEGEEEGSGEKLLSIEAYYTGDNFEIKKSVTVNMPKPTAIDPKDLLRRHKGPP